MDPTTTFRLAQIIYAERVAEAEAYGEHSWLPEEQTRVRAALLGAIRSFVASLRPGQRPLDVQQPASQS